MRSSLRLFRVFGIDIGVHFSWIFIFLLVTWSLSAITFPQLYPGWSTALYWTIGTIAGLLLFVSVLIHELAHSLVARARGMVVSSITLFLLGGVSNLQEEPERPKTEFLMAIVGPLSSLVLAGIFWLLSGLGTPDSPVNAIISYLALINALLAAFNLLPGFPLDGGRVLRSIVWAATGNIIKATNAATVIGQLFGWAFIGFGVYQLFGGNLIGGVWIAFIGWFLNNSAGTARRETTLKEYLSDISVGQIMSRDTQVISPDTTVEQLVRGVFQGHHERAVPVCVGGRLQGIVSVTDVKELPREKWAETTVGQIMTREPLYTVVPEDPVNKAFELIAQRNINQVIVVRQNDCAGILNRADLIRYLELSKDLGKPKK